MSLIPKLHIFVHYLIIICSHQFTDNHLPRCHSLIPPSPAEIKTLTETIFAWKVEKFREVLKPNGLGAFIAFLLSVYPCVQFPGT